MFYIKKGRVRMLSSMRIASPVGPLTLVADASQLLAVLWPNEGHQRMRFEKTCEDLHHPVLVEAQRQLTEYFRGKRTTFELPIHFLGTAFQQRVWRQLLSIPYGQTRSYGQVARAIGNPSSFRAVGAANGKNPLSIVVPCHRVIGASGELTGFGGGLDVKAALLDLEGASSNFP